MKTFGVVVRIKAPVGYTGVWVNIYKRGKCFFAGGSYKSRTRANVIAKPYRYDCVYMHIRLDK